MIVLVGGFYTYYYTDHMHFHVTKLYAHAGYDIAQHKLGQYYLNGKLTEERRILGLGIVRKLSGRVLGLQP